MSSTEATEKEVRSLLTDFTVANGDETSKAWRDLFPTLLTTYRDGFIVKDLDKKEVNLVACKFNDLWSYVL